MNKPFQYTDEHKQFIFANYKGVFNSDLTKMFNDKFGTSLTDKQIICFKYRNGLKSELPIGWTKCKHSHITRPVGTRREIRGTIEVKTESGWKRLSHIVWEEHNGEIQKGMQVMFLDGDKMNCEISNLYLVSKAELINTIKHRHLSNVPEITKANVLLTKIKLKGIEKLKGVNDEA